MDSISHLTSHTAPRNDINPELSRPSLLMSRNVVANRHDFSHEQRLGAAASQSCYDQMLNIPKMVGDFLVHRYADTRMFIRAFSSMFGSTTSSEIDRRVNEIRQFRTVMQDCQVTGQTANRRFERLTPQTQALFFYTDASYMAQFQNETDPARAGAIRFEILRECNQVISFQSLLTVVNTFFLAFTGGTASTSVHPPEETPSIWDALARCLGQRGMPRPGGNGGRRGGPEDPSPVPAPGAALPGVDLNIPNTVPYVRDAIPAAIQTKADEIIRLRAVFTGAIPVEYEDQASADFMAIPVFDASHPLVQGGLPGLRTALAGGTGATGVLHNHRNARHTLERDSLETHISGGTSWAPAKCMLCRHPEHGGIRREALRIDTGLQDEILQYLRTHVPAGT